MHMITNLLLAWLWIMYQANPSVAQNDQLHAQNDQLPAQLQCQNHQAVYFTADLLQKLPKEWFVARATLRTVLPNGVPEPKINTCSPLNYLQACQGGMIVENDWDGYGNLIKVTKAYSKEYDNVVEYWESVTRRDPNFLVFAGFVASMTLHFRNGKWQKIETKDIPDIVYHAEDRMYAMIEFGYTTDTGKIEWALYQACDEDFAWIEIAQWVVKANRLQEVNAVIDDFLGKNPLTIPQMVKLITVLPFEV